MKRFSFLLATILSFSQPTLPMGGLFGNGGGLIDYDRAAAALRPVIIDAMRAQGESLAAGFDGLADKMANAFVRGMAEGMGAGVNGLFDTLNAQMQDGSQGNEALRRMWDNIFKGFADNFGQDGNARQGANNFFETFAQQFAEGGQGARVGDEFFRSMGRLFQERGAINDATNEAGNFVRRQFGIGGNLDGIVNEAADNLQRNVLGEGSRIDTTIRTEARGFAKRIADTLGESFKENMGDGSGIDTALKEFLELIPRRINGVYDLLINRNIAKTSSYIAGAITLTLSAQYGTKVAWRWIETEFFKPKLLINYDANGARSDFMSFLRKKPQPTQMIFPEELEEQLSDIVLATRNIHRKILGGVKNVKYRNVLLWGPPGTGKTMFAKRLAQESGLAWAHMSGSSFSKFKDGEGIEALDELMRWAKRKKGLLIFIDEAESLIAKRENTDPNSKAYQLLTNFLNYTGERSDKFMLVMATNHKDVIDSAMRRRIDDLVHIPLPEQEERMQVLALYRDKILLDTTQNTALFVESVHATLSDKKIAQIAAQTKGLSNGDLEGIMNMIKTDADITDDGLVTPTIINRAVRRAIEKHKEFTASLNPQAASHGGL